MVARKVKVVPDQVKFGQADYWAVADGSGDCEDIAMAKMKRLISVGVDRRALRLAIVFGVESGMHAVLIATIEGTDYILDNMTNKMVPWDRSGYAFLAVQSRANPLAWVNVDMVKSFAAAGLVDFRRPS